MLNKLFLILLTTNLLLAQDRPPIPVDISNPPPAKNSDTTNSDTNINSDTTAIIKYEIEYFGVKDLSSDTYWVSIVSKKPTELMDELAKNKYRIEIGGVKTDIRAKSIKPDSDNPSMINFLVSAYSKIEEGKKEITLFSNSQKEPLSSIEFLIPPVNDKPGNQPFISKIDPEGGTRGDAITISGSNFGGDIDNISIALYEQVKDSNGDETYNDIDERKPFYLSPVINESQEVKFNIPLKKDLMKTGQFRKSLKIKMFVAGRPSNYIELTLLPSSWKLYAGIIGLIITILFLIFLYLILKKLINKEQEREMNSKGGVKRPSIVHFFELILTDRVTNTYSLSKFQAFTWTIAAIGSYSYVIISQGLLLRNGKIPDFNATLITLMSISYGGLIAANGLGAKKPKNEVKAKPPQLSNLFCEGGSVDLSRLQLFGFTIVSIGAYIYNLALGNPLLGLPDIPPTLLGLMGASQTGYLGSKAVGKESVINIVTPNNVEIDQADIPVSILGSGFVRDTKVLLDCYPTPISTECKVPSELTFIMPKLEKEKVTIGQHVYLTLYPPAGAPILSNIYIEIVEAGKGGTTTHDAETDSVEQVSENRDEYGASDDKDYS